MNPDFEQVLRAPDADKRDLFLAVARRLGTTEQNIEKDFWVCWILDALFNALPRNGPRLLFKGGTSLSKGYGLIKRFSEDIDITVFRGDIGEPTTTADLEALTGKKRKARLDAIRNACRQFIQGPLRAELSTAVAHHLAQCKIGHGEDCVIPDEHDPDQQSLLFCYPSVTAPTDTEYIRPAVKIESGAKSALDPHEIRKIVPYVAEELVSLNLVVQNVTIVHPARTFWDKVIILHGVRQWFERRHELRQEGQRVSRHYYDVHQVLASTIGAEAARDRELGVDCVRHARMFFNRPDLGLESALPGKFTLVPAPGMLDHLHRDYKSMTGMVFGIAPAFDEVLESIQRLEESLNGTFPHVPPENSR
jgi:hypothetical protein